MNTLLNLSAVLLPECFASFVHQNAKRVIFFEDLTGKKIPWEIEYESFSKMRKILSATEHELRRQSHDPIFCLCTEKGVYWLEGSKYQNYLENTKEHGRQEIGEPLNQLRRLTTAEINQCHLNNMRALILQTAHDSVVLEQLKMQLHNNYSMVQREAKQSMQTVWRMILEMQGKTHLFNLAEQQFVILFERCMITQDMLDSGEIDKEQLGYDADHLRRVSKLLEERLREYHNHTIESLQSMNQNLKESLRQGEVSQLVRINRWNKIKTYIQDFPEELLSQFAYYNDEKKRIAHIITQRERELGESKEGNKTLMEMDVIEQMQNQSPHVNELFFGFEQMQSNTQRVNGANLPQFHHSRMAVMERKN